MTDVFDPYRKWLGIPPAEQPPDHYRLLGIGRFEDDPDTISSAADRQMAHLRTFQSGPHSADSQRLLNEVSAARVCLLHPSKKAEYDARLRARQAMLAPAAMPAPVRTAPVAVAVDVPRIRLTPRKKKSSTLGLMVAGAVLLAALAGLLAIVGRHKDDSEETRLIGTVAEADRPASEIEVGDGPRQKTKGKAPADKSPSSANTSQPAEPPAGHGVQPAKLAIIEARWGTEEQWQDITESVRALVNNDELLATASGSFYQGMADPAFGQAKRVSIRYRRAGQSATADFADGELVYLSGRSKAASEPSPAGLELLEARYGAATTWIDVLPRVKRWQHGDRLAIRAGLVVPTDPLPGQRKALFVRYRTTDGEFYAHAWDNEELVLDARPIAAGDAIDLIAAADPERSSGSTWSKLDRELVAPAAPGTLRISAARTNDYLLTAVVGPEPRPDNVAFSFPVGDRYVQLAVDGWASSISALQLVDGKLGPENPTARHLTICEPGQPTIIRCAVRDSHIFATCNGRVVADWQGDSQRLSVADELPAGEQPAIRAYGLGTRWRVERLQLAPLVPEAKPPTSSDESDEVVDLLKQIEPRLDEVFGDWQLTKEGLLSPAGERMRLQIPYFPGDDYELRLVATRKSGGDGLFVGLVVDGQQTMIAIDGWGGNVSGLHFLDGQTAERNATRTDGRMLVDDQPIEIVCTVHPMSVRVTCDGQTRVDWRGDARRLSMEPSLCVPDELGLALADWHTSFLISKLELKPLPPPAAEPPLDVAQSSTPGAAMEADAPPSDAPRPLPDLLDNSGPPAAEDDRRLPLPMGEELAVAAAKVDARFASQWQAANDLDRRLAVARAMFEAGLQTRDDSVLRYALWRAATSLAVSLGDVSTACDSLAQIDHEFQIDTVAEKLAAVSAAVEHVQVPTQIGTLALASTLLTDRAVREARFDEARKFGALANGAARRTRDKALRAAAEHALAGVRSGQERHTKFRAAVERLRQQPDDADANLAAGLALCLDRSDWQRGLPLIARSRASGWVEIAELEQAAGKDAGKRTALVDAWLAAAEKQKGALRVEYQLQAKYWYQRGLSAEALANDVPRKAALEKLEPLPAISPARLIHGLEMDMFDGGDFQQFRARRVDGQIYHRFGFDAPDPALPGDFFSIRWTGWLKAPVAGTYVFQTNSDDSIRVQIGEKRIIDHWNRGAGDETAELELTDGFHPLVVEYNDYTANADVGLRWALKDLTESSIVPAEALFHDPTVLR